MSYLARIAFIISLQLSCAILVCAQNGDRTPPPKRKFKHHEIIDTTYNKTKDETLIRLDRMWISEQRTFPTRSENNLMMTIFYTYPGTVPTPPQSVVIAFLSIGKGAVYANNRKLIFYADKERLDLGSMDLIEKQVLGLDNIREILSLPITYEMLLRIISAKKVRIELGDTTWYLSESQLEAMRDTASRAS